MQIADNEGILKCFYIYEFKYEGVTIFDMLHQNYERKLFQWFKAYKYLAIMEKYKSKLDLDCLYT